MTLRLARNPPSATAPGRPRWCRAHAVGDAEPRSVPSSRRSRTSRRRSRSREGRCRRSTRRDAGDPRRQQVLLDLRRRAGLPCAGGRCRTRRCRRRPAASDAAACRASTRRARARARRRRAGSRRVRPRGAGGASTLPGWLVRDLPARRRGALREEARGRPPGGRPSVSGKSSEPAGRSEGACLRGRSRYSATEVTPASRRASDTICSPSRCGGTLLRTSVTSSGVGPPASSPVGAARPSGWRRPSRPRDGARCRRAPRAAEVPMTVARETPAAAAISSRLASGSVLSSVSVLSRTRSAFWAASVRIYMSVSRADATKRDALSPVPAYGVRFVAPAGSLATATDRVRQQRTAPRSLLLGLLLREDFMSTLTAAVQVSDSIQQGLDSLVGFLPRARLPADPGHQASSSPASSRAF